MEIQDYRCHNFIADLDVNLVYVGIGLDTIRWRVHAPGTGDNFYRLHFPHKGAYCLDYADGSIPVERGFGYLIPAFVPFTFRGMQPCDHDFIHFYSKRLRRIGDIRSAVVVPLANLEEELAAIRRFVEEARQIDSLEKEIRLRNKLLLILTPFLKKLLDDSAVDPEQADLLSGLTGYIDRNLGQTIRISELAVRARLSRVELGYLIKKALGISPKQYLISRRILRAKNLLWHSSLRVKEIMEQCGFESRQLFHRIFKRQTGFTPLEYRKRKLMD